MVNGPDREQFLPVLARARAIRHSVGPVAYDFVKLIFVRPRHRPHPLRHRPHTPPRTRPRSRQPRYPGSGAGPFLRPARTHPPGRRGAGPRTLTVPLRTPRSRRREESARSCGFSARLDAAEGTKGHDIKGTPIPNSAWRVTPSPQSRYARALGVPHRTATGVHLCPPLSGE